MRRGTRVSAALTAVVVAAAVAGLAGCGAGPAEGVSVARVEVQDASTITLVFGTCVPHPEVDVTQSDDVVEVAVTSAGGGDCDPWLRVPLDAPLGERAVVDARRGGELSVVGRTRTVAIGEAVVSRGGQVLVLTVPTCDAQTEVTRLVETAETVEVEVTATGGSTTLECLDAVEVPLEAPLGDRVLLDASTGEPVPSIGYLAGS